MLGGLLKDLIKLFKAQLPAKTISWRNKINIKSHVKASFALLDARQCSCLKITGVNATEWSGKTEFGKAKFLTAGDACDDVFWLTQGLKGGIFDSTKFSQVEDQWTPPSLPPSRPHAKEKFSAGVHRWSIPRKMKNTIPTKYCHNSADSGN